MMRICHGFVFVFFTGKKTIQRQQKRRRKNSPLTAIPQKYNSKVWPKERYILLYSSNCVMRKAVIEEKDTCIGDR